MVKSNNYRNNEQDRRITKLEGHIETINHELGAIKIDIEGIKTDIRYLKKMMWVILVAILGAILTMIGSAILS